MAGEKLQQALAEYDLKVLHDSIKYPPIEPTP